MGVPQILWSETHPNKSCAAARWEALGVPLLFKTGDLDSYRACTHAARQRTTGALRTSGCLRLANTHRIPAWRERGALTRDWHIGRQRQRERRSDGTEVGRLLEHVAVTVRRPCCHLRSFLLAAPLKIALIVHRPAREEIIRRGTFRIRCQQ